MSVFSYLLLFIGTHGLLLSTAMFNKYRVANNDSKSRSGANLYTAIVLMIISFRLLYYMLHHNGTIYSYQSHFDLSYAMLICVGPLMYASSNSLQAITLSPKQKYFLFLFLPLSFFFIYFQCLYIFNHWPYRWRTLDLVLAGTNILILKAAFGNFAIPKSELKAISYWKWNRLLIAVNITGYFLFFAYILIRCPILNSMRSTNFQYAYLLLIPTVYWVGLEPFVRPGERLNSKQKNKSVELSKIENSDNQKLIDILENGKMYASSNLSLEDLATKMQISRHALSEMINLRFNTNFYGLINFYRVQEAIRLLEKGGSKYYTIESIGKTAGFKSKTAFYQNFKKHTGVTPSGFLGKLNALKN